MAQKPVLYSLNSANSQQLSNCHPFHYYPVFAHVVPGPRIKYKKNIFAKLVSRQSLHSWERGEEKLLTKGCLALRGCPCAGEGRGASYTTSVRQSFQRLPSSTVTKSRKPSSSRRDDQTFKTFKGPSTIRLKHKERAHIRCPWFVTNKQVCDDTTVAEGHPGPVRDQHRGKRSSTCRDRTRDRLCSSRQLCAPQLPSWHSHEDSDLQ